MVLAVGGNGQVRGLAAIAVVEDDVHSIGRHIVGIYIVANGGHSAAGPGAGAVAIAVPCVNIDLAPVGAVGEVDGLGGSGGAAGVAAGVAAACCITANHIAQSQRAVGVVAHGEGQGLAVGNGQLVGSAGHAVQGLHRGGGDLTGPTVAHILHTVAVDDPDIAGLIKAHGQLAVHKTVVITIVSAGVGGVEQVVVISHYDFATGAPVAELDVIGVIAGRGDQVFGLIAGVVVEDDVGSGGGDGSAPDAALYLGHLGTGPCCGSLTCAVVPAVDVGSGPVFGVNKVDGPGGSSTAGGAGAAGLVSHISIAAVAVAISAVAAVRAGLGGGVVNNGHTGVTHGAVDAAAADGELVAGQLIVVGTAGHGVNGQVDITATVVEVGDDHAGITTLVVVQVGAGILSQVLGLTCEMVVEVVDLLGELAGPAKLCQLAHLLIDAVLGIGVNVFHVVGTGEVQGHGVGAGSGQSPCLVADIVAGVQGGQITDGIVRLCPQHQLVSGSVLEVGLTQSGGIVLFHLVTDVVGPDGLGGAHVLGVSADGQAAVVVGILQQLTVVVRSDASGGLSVRGGAVDHSGPEIAGVAGVVIGSLDLLGCVKTEAVHAAVNILLHQGKSLVLHLLVAGVDIGQASHTTLSHVVAVIIAGGVLGIIVPAGRIIQEVRVHHGAKLVCAVVGGVVEHHIHDDLDAILVCLGTQVDQFFLGTHTVALGFVDVEADRLINGPPVVYGLIDSALLHLLHGRYLDGGIAHIGDQAQICLDVGNGPVPALQRNTVLDVGHQVGTVDSRCVCLDVSRHGGQHERGDHCQCQNQTDDAVGKRSHVFSS